MGFLYLNPPRLSKRQKKKKKKKKKSTNCKNPIFDF